MLLESVGEIREQRKRKIKMEECDLKDLTNYH